MAVHHITVAKIEESELNELRTFLQDVGEKVKNWSILVKLVRSVVNLL